MNTERFNVVLDGATLRGQDVAAVAAKLAKLIKRDTDFALRLLGGQPTKLKSGIDAATGARYIEALERIGVAVRLEQETLEVDAELSAPSATPNQGQTHGQAKTAGAKTVDQFGPSGEVVVPVCRATHIIGRRADQFGPSGEVVVDANTSGLEPSLEYRAESGVGAAMAWPRLWARQIDFALCWAITVGVAFLVGTTLLPPTTNIFLQLAAALLISALVLIGYETLSLGAFGTTLGKAALGLRVEMRSGEKIKLGRALRRSVGVWWLGSGAYLFFPAATIVIWWSSRRRLRKTSTTPWDDSCLTRVAGGPVALWRATFAGIIAITALTVVVGLNAAMRKETIRVAHESLDKSFGLLPTPAGRTEPSPAQAATGFKPQTTNLADYEPITGAEIAGDLVGTWECRPMDQRSGSGPSVFVYHADGTTADGKRWHVADDQRLYEENPFSNRADGYLQMRLDWGKIGQRFVRTVIETGIRLSCEKRGV
jgi:uncharacterized RDD family membrane protein YckC